MAHYFRRIVSGNQARFKDHDLKIELNLVYLTDQVIIMGYPALGIEGLYRNHKKDAVKFLESRHGNNYWVFNFCPTRERSYDASIFGGRVSRYPFPDDHPPPLALMPLPHEKFVLGYQDRQTTSLQRYPTDTPKKDLLITTCAMLAGKGRSGMMACAYLLSLDELPVPPQLERSYTAKQ